MQKEKKKKGPYDPLFFSISIFFAYTQAFLRKDKNSEFCFKLVSDHFISLSDCTQFGIL